MEINGSDYYKYNSAWSYLKNNYENERADTLQQFINLLSQISSESPWYFNQVSGVDEALNRENWEVQEDRKKITINCLDDSVDHRIESLLSMYRSIVWSHVRKCEVLPANLRKFDMGLFVFSGYIQGLAGSPADPTPSTGKKQMVGIKQPKDWNPIGGNDLSANYKYIEFHNCEISLDSLSSGYSDLNNGEGIHQAYNIDIYFDDCYEKTFNPFLLKEFGDFFLWDTWTSVGRSDSGVALGEVPDEADEIESLNPAWEMTMNNRLHPYGEATNTPGTESVSTGSSNIFQKVLSQMADRASRLGQTVTSVGNGVIQSMQNSAINAVTGDLGNIYGNGMGMLGSAEAIADTVQQQVLTLGNAIAGNISGTLTGASRAATRATTAPIQKTITAPFEGWGDNHFSNGKGDLGNLYGEKQQTNTSRTLRNNL